MSEEFDPADYSVAVKRLERLRALPDFLFR